MNLIENIIEPKRLFLAWQPDRNSDESRKRRIIAEFTKEENNNVGLKFLDETEDFKKACQSGLLNYPHFLPNRKDMGKGIPPFIINFLRRIPSRKRSDFNLFLESIRIDPTVTISDFAILGYSGALLPSDSFSLIHPFDDADQPCELLIEAVGFRYHEGMGLNLKIGDEVHILPEPDNPVDPNAIKIEYDGKIIGYANRFLTTAFHIWLKKWKVSAEIEKIVTRGAKPKVMIFVRVRTP